MEDNRKYPRYVVYWRCAIVVAELGRTETIQCKINDISLSGISIVCHRSIPPPTVITVYLMVNPGDKTHPEVIVEVQGKILYNILSGPQGGFRLGIEFTKFAQDGMNTLQKNLPKG